MGVHSMSSVKTMEEMLEKYCYHKSRSIFLEKEKRMLMQSYPEERMFHSDFFDKYTKIDNGNKRGKAQENKHSISIDDFEKFRNQKIKKIDNELSQSNYQIEIIDDSLNMIKEYNERYKIVIEGYYIKKIRMEDIAEMTHTSRSRCYELCKEAIAHMAKMVFGDS